MENASVVSVLMMAVMTAAAAAAYHPNINKKRLTTAGETFGAMFYHGPEPSRCNGMQLFVTSHHGIPIKVDILARTYAHSPYLSKRDHT